MQNSNGMEKEGIGENVLIRGHKCHRCGHAWRPYDLDQVPIVCPKCKSPYWKTARKNTGKKGKNGQ